MKIHMTNRPARIPILVAPVALSLALAGCSVPETPVDAAATSAPVFPVFIQTATDPPPPRVIRTTPVEQGVPTHGPGLYKLDLGSGTGPAEAAEAAEQFLLCMFYEGPGDVVICKANIPVRWKELDGQHKQANRVVIHQEVETNTLEVRADSEDMATIRIVPTDITEEAVISGLHVRVEDSEAHFSLDPEEAVGSVLITPDSYEVITESSPLSTQDEAQNTSPDSAPRAAKVKVT